MRNLLLILTVLALTACGHRPYLAKQQYLLTADNPTTHYTPIAMSLKIDDTTSSALYHNNALLYRLKGNQVTHDFYHIFAISPSHIITNNTTAFFRQNELFQHVFTINLNLEADYVLKSNLIALDADYTHPDAPMARLEIEYILLNAQHTIVLDKHYVASQRLSEKTTDALIKAWNQGLTDILSNAAHDIAEMVAPDQALKIEPKKSVIAQPMVEPAVEHLLRLETNKTDAAQAAPRASQEPSAQAVLRLDP